eukprot:14218816-Alexandrium_andersonii.AAC.1
MAPEERTCVGTWQMGVGIWQFLTGTGVAVWHLWTSLQASSAWVDGPSRALYTQRTRGSMAAVAASERAGGA